MSAKTGRAAASKPGGLRLGRVLRPHWKALVLALAAVIGETAADVLEPWPVTIIGFVYTVFMIGTAGGMSVTVVGLPLLAGGLYLSRLTGRFERARARMLLGVRVDEPSPGAAAMSSA